MHDRSPQGLLVAICVAFSVAFLPEVLFSEVYVNGYYRKDGTYVQPHYRSDPEGNFYINWRAYPIQSIPSPNSAQWQARLGLLGEMAHDSSQRQQAAWAGMSDLAAAGVQQAFAKEELADQRAHEEKLLQMQLEHERNMFGASAKQKAVDEKNSIEFIPREQATKAVHNSRLNARISANANNSIGSNTPTDRTSNLYLEESRSSQLNDFKPVQKRQQDSVRFAGRVVYFNEKELLHTTRDIEADIQTNDVTVYKASGIYYNFTDGFLRSAELKLTPSEMRSAGGFESLMTQAKSSFGMPIEEDQHTALWLFPEADRLVMAGAEGDSWCLFVTRKSLLTQEQIDSLIP